MTLLTDASPQLSNDRVSATNEGVEVLRVAAPVIIAKTCMIKHNRDEKAISKKLYQGGLGYLMRRRRKYRLDFQGVIDMG